MTTNAVYKQLVYRTSIRISWVIVLIFILFYIDDPDRFQKMSIIKLILFIGLLISFVYWYYLDKNPNCKLDPKIASVVRDHV